MGARNSLGLHGSSVLRTSLLSAQASSFSPSVSCGALSLFHLYFIHSFP